MAIVVAIDESERSRAAAIEADKLARVFDDEIRFLHVITEPEHTRLVERQSTSMQTGTGDVADNAARDVADELPELVSAAYDVVGRIGNPATEIVEYADEVDARYVVLARRSRSAVGKAVFGSIVQNVLLNADCPVITVEPDG